MENPMIQHFTVCVLLTILMRSMRIEGQGTDAIYRRAYRPSSDVEGETDTPSQERWKPLSSRWGMPDATAHVGKVFRYTIPSDAFSGDIVRFQVTEAESAELPSWLYFDSASSSIEGIASEADIGQYYISVTAVGHKTNTTAASQITEVFSVSVTQQDITRPNGAMREDDAVVTCPDNKIPAVATIILDAEWSKLPAQERVAIVAKMSKYSMLKIGAFRLLPNGRRMAALHEKVLVTGPGNIPAGLHKGVSLSWKIGCGDNAANLPVVTILEAAAKDGSMAEQFGLDVIGWQVTGQKAKPKMRVRRQVNLAGTPMPTPIPSVTPTSVAPSSTLVPPTTSMAPTTSSMMPSRTVTMVTTPVVTPTPTPPTTPSTTPPVTPPTTMEPTEEPPVTPTEPLTTVPPMTSTGLVSPTVTSSSMVQPTMTPTAPPTTKPPTRPPPMVPKTPKPVDRAPVISNKINRVNAREGVPLVYVVPADTFMDEEGDTRNLKIDVLENSGKKLGRKSWLQFDKQNQMLHGLPPSKFPGGSSRRPYVMTAEDSNNGVTRMPFEVVIATKEQDTVEPPVTMSTTLNIDFDEFMSNPALQLEILNRISSIFGDDDASAITITGVQRGSVVITWTNNTIAQDSCPAALIAEMMAKLVNPDGTPTQALIDALAPNYTISGVEAMEGGSCITTTPLPPKVMTTEAAGAGGQTDDDEGAWIGLVPAIVIVLILLLAGIIILLLYRKHRKGKLSDEDNNTFINKGIPIILPDEIEEAEKPPPDSSSPLIMSNEKPPLPPPEYNTTQEGSKEPLLNSNENHRGSDEDDKNSLPMADIQKPEPPQQGGSQGKQAPVNTPGYRVPPPYVPP